MQEQRMASRGLIITPPSLKERINDYALQNGLPWQDAARKLIELGFRYINGKP